MAIWRLEIWRKNLIWGSPYDATVDINNVLFHWMIKQINVANVLF
jgi:hypothetical protein